MNLTSFFESINKNRYYGVTLCTGTLIFLSSCTGAKFLGENERLLVHQSVDGVGPIMTSHIGTLQEQEPNARLIDLNKRVKGPAHLVYIYELGKRKLDTVRVLNKIAHIEKKYNRKIDKAKREKKKRKLRGKKRAKISDKEMVLKEGNQLMRWGEPLAVYDPEKTLLVKEKIEQYLDTWGYFDKQVTVTEEGLDADSIRIAVDFDIKRGTQYQIDSIQYQIPDPKVYDLYTSKLDEAILKKGWYRQIDLTAERDRIYELMVNNGYFNFTKDLVLFEVDSVSLGLRQLLVRLLISNPPNEDNHKHYTIDSVIFVTDAGLNVRQSDTTQYGKVTYTFGRYKFSPKVLDWKNYIYPDNEFRRNNTFETQRHLSYLDNFKFINVNYDTTGGEFLAYIFTRPSERFQTSSEVGLSVTQGLPGPFVSVNAKNRNTFRGLEVVDLNGNFKVEGNGAVLDVDRTYSSVLYGADLNITFPQFLIPFGRFYKKKVAKFNPVTRAGVSIGQELRLTEYERTIFNANFNYVWKAREHIALRVTPLDVSLINASLDSGFQAELENLAPSYARTFNSSFVSGGSFELTINDNYGSGRNESFFKTTLEVGGNLLSLLGDNPLGGGLEYFQFAKTSIDYRRNHRINKRADFVGRIHLGVALPYSSGQEGFNTDALPYEKYFFGGGSISNRAWQPRRLGPGSYGVVATESIPVDEQTDLIQAEIDENGFREINYQLEQPGDMIIETNLEVRQDLFGFVHWALFLDAGNIWLIRSNTVNTDRDFEGDDGVFRFSSLAQDIAVGMGWGLRFDLSFLVFRVDFGYKIIDPAQAPGNKWVAWENDILDISDKFPYIILDPFKNAQINIGIGYPF